MHPHRENLRLYGWPAGDNGEGFGSPARSRDASENDQNAEAAQPGDGAGRHLSNAVEAWLKAHTKGEWVTVSTLKEGIHGYEMKLGSGVAERALLSMSRSDRIDLWLSKNKDGQDMPLPPGYAGRRPPRGLVRIHGTREVG